MCQLQRMRARALILQRPAHMYRCVLHAGCPFNCIANNLLQMLFAVSPLFRLFALRRFAEGQDGPHPQCMTPSPAPHATRCGASLREHLPNASDVLMSTSDVRRELLSSLSALSVTICFNDVCMLHAHACSHATACMFL